MNNLYAALPQAVCIEGKQYPLYTDYRVALRVLAAFEDPALTLLEQQGILLALLYGGAPPSNTALAVHLGVLFLNCGRPAPEQPAGFGPRLFSFTHDASLIYAAIQRSHGVDVLAQPMHWYRFAALFSDIGEDTFFARLVALRAARLAGTLTPQQRAACAQLGHWLALPDNAPLTQEECAFFAALKAGTAPAVYP